jgi:hypothetical protein
MAARIAALGAAAIIAAVGVLHVYATLADDESDGGNASVFAVGLAAAAALAVAAPFLGTRERRFGFLATAAALTTVLAVVSGFSVGPLLVPAVLLLLYAAFAAL